MCGGIGSFALWLWPMGMGRNGHRGVKFEPVRLLEIYVGASIGAGGERLLSFLSQSRLENSVI